MRYEGYTGRRVSKKYIAWPYFLTAALLFFAGIVFITFFRGMSFLFAFLLVLGILFIIYGSLNFLCGHFDHIKKIKIVKNARIIMWCMATLWLLSFAAVQLIIVKGGIEDANPGAAAIIVLGAGLYGEEPSEILVARMEAAVDYLRNNPETFAILSGGQGPGEDIPESEAMWRYISAKGIQSERLLQEDQSSNTSQNIRFSKTILQSLGLSEKRIVLISQRFHLYRARTLAGINDLRVETLEAAIPNRYVDAFYRLREYFSVIFMWLGRR